MTILEDTRQQAGKHKNIADYCEQHKVELVRQALFVGDYTLVTDQSVAIDTKKDLSELVMDVGTDKSRFLREVARAKKHGIKLIVLCEHSRNVTSLNDVAAWNNPMLNPANPRYNPRAMTGKVLMRRLIDIHINYGTEFLFCDKKHTGEMVVGLLTESKHRKEAESTS